MTLTECWNELLAMVPDTVPVQFDVTLFRNRKGSTSFEFTAWAGKCRYVEADSCEQLVQKFRSNVLPELGLTPKVDVAKELDCEIGANA